MRMTYTGLVKLAYNGLGYSQAQLDYAHMDPIARRRMQSQQLTQRRVQNDVNSGMMTRQQADNYNTFRQNQRRQLSENYWKPKMQRAEQAVRETATYLNKPRYTQGGSANTGWYRGSQPKPQLADRQFDKMQVPEQGSFYKGRMNRPAYEQHVRDYNKSMALMNVRQQSQNNAYVQQQRQAFQQQNAGTATAPRRPSGNMQIRQGYNAMPRNAYGAMRQRQQRYRDPNMV